MGNNPVQEWCSLRFRRLLTGAPDGVAPWTGEISEGVGEGLFAPGEAPWVVHGDIATLVGGVRALLMQALHPGSLAGVRTHSRYREDPLGRLTGTIRWLTVTTFASREAVEREAGRVNRMHDRVKGEYRSATGESRSYRAADPDLLRWVHVAFMDSFLRCHQLYSWRPIPGGADAYVRLWARSVEPLGLTEVPRSEAELVDCMAGFLPELTVNDHTREVLQWLRDPPLPFVARRVYSLLFQAALASLPEEHRRLVGIRSLPMPVIRPLVRGMLRSIRILIGEKSPLEEAALERLGRRGEGTEER
jgi:uncharacterized protein (DUF2236 family)